MSLRFPFVPPLEFEIQGVGLPGTAPPKSLFLSPLVQLLNVLPDVVVVTDFSLTESPLPPKPGMFTVPLEALICAVWLASVGGAEGVTPHVVLPFQRS